MTRAAPARPLRRRRGKSALLVLAALLFMAGALRLSIGAGTALTDDTPTLAPAIELSDEAPEQPGLDQLLESLRDRERWLEKREAALAERLRALEVSEARLEAQLAALITAEQQLGETLALADQAAERDLARLTQVYENMRPADAAALFGEMDTSFAAGFIARMKPDSAAAIMAGLAPNTAYAISVILAGRHVGVPTQ